VSCSSQKKLMSSVKITKTINGVAMDKNGPLPGAAIQVKNTNRGTYTDVDGKFEIIVNENEVLIIRYVGLESKEITVTDKNYYEVKLELATPFVSRKEKRRIKRELRKHGFYIYPD
jgi:hypothetical protein